MSNASMSLDQKMVYFAKDTIESLKKNFKTQAIFPFEVYPGYKAKNAKAKPGSWKSTGAAYDSFYFQVKDASETDARMDFFYNYYLNYVDMGVGAGRKAGDVERNNTASVDLKYYNWNAQQRKTHRPAISMEFRHLAGRMALYFKKRYQRDAEFTILNAFGVEMDEGK